MSVRRLGFVSIILLLIVLTFGAAYGQGDLIRVTQWPVSEGGNGHWYAVLTGERNVDGAREAAHSYVRDGSPGYLATITSPSENEFIYHNLLAGLGRPQEKDHYFTGGFWSEKGWQWVTGEPWTYVNWSGSAPFWGSWPDSYVTIHGDMFNGNGYLEARSLWSLEGKGCLEAGDCIWSVVEWGEPEVESPDSVLCNMIQHPDTKHWYGIIPLQRTYQEHDSIARTYSMSGEPGYLAMLEDPYEAEWAKQIYWEVNGGDDSNRFYFGMRGWESGYADVVEGNWGPHGFGYSSTIENSARLWAIIEFDFSGVTPLDSTYVRLRQWKASEGGNDHWYALFTKRLSHKALLDSAKNVYLNGIPGNLATITTAAENQFIEQNILANAQTATRREESYFIGGVWTANGWKWITNEPWEYENWSPYEPGPPGQQTNMVIWSERQFLEPKRVPGKWASRLDIWTGTTGAMTNWGIIEWPNSILCGDVNNDEAVDMNDLIYLHTYYFAYGPPPPFLTAADLNGDGQVDFGDVAGIALLLSGQLASPCGAVTPPTEDHKPPIRDSRTTQTMDKESY